MAKLFEFQAESMPSWWDGNYQSQAVRDVLTEIQKDGSSQVVIVPTVYMDGLSSTTVYRDNGDLGGNNVDGRPRTESDNSIRTAISEAKARGLEVIFKLHVNMQNDDWNALIGPGNNPDGTPPTEEQWATFGDAWFASYKQAVLHYARLAKEQGVTTFAIGNECESMTHPRFTEHWKDIIADVREIVGESVKLTYAATWTESLHVGFWEDLDYVGVNPYIAFTQSNFNPTLQQLIDGWTKPSDVSSTSVPIIQKFGQNISAMDALKWVAQQFGKKLVFTEAGFRSMDGNNTAPWQWGEPHPVDEVEQLNMHKAFYKIITDRLDEGWLAGYWFWNYDASAGVIDPAPDVGYSTHGKLADALVEQYFKDPRSVTGLEKAGTSFADTLGGGFNNDTLIGGLGNDSLRGNKGADVFSYSGGDGADTILDFSYAQGDRIRLLNAGVTNYADLQVATITGGYRISFNDGGSITILTSDQSPSSQIRSEWFTFTVGQTGPSAKPTSGDDEITGTSRANVVNALAGNDIIRGLGGSDRLTAGIGDDTIDAGDGNDVVYGNAGDDYLEGYAGADRLYGGEGADIVYGGIGNDLVRGDAGNDMLYGDAGNDLVRGGEGFDLVSGADGNDKLYGEAGNDQLTGGAGNDTMQGGLGDDRVEGGEGDDRLYGGDGKDIVEGWFGNDHLWGGKGDDVITPGGGADRMWGGKGADNFLLGQGMGKDTIYDFKLKEEDQLIIQGNINGTGIGLGNSDAEVMQTLRARMKQVGRDTVIDLGEGDSLTLKNFKGSTLQRDDLWFW